jgi:multiple sugar transport system substrate-binding protein
MSRKRIVWMLLVLMLPILAACGGTPSDGGGAASVAPASEAAASVAPASEAAASVAPASEAAASDASTGQTDSDSLAVSQSGYQGTLNYWVLGYQPDGANLTGQLMDAAVAAFEEANPDIQVEITGYPGTQEGFTKLTQAVQGGDSVDIFRLPSDILPLLVKDGLVAPIDEFLTEEDRADIYPNLLQAASIDGQAYAWPLWVPPVGMYLNLDIF